jgi:heme/copper-type cytochrome/quinol oxidase subunit 2
MPPACEFVQREIEILEGTMIKEMARTIGVGLLALSGTAQAAFQWNLPSPVTRVASEIYDLHLIMMVIILAIFVGVFGVMFYSIYAHRKSVGHKAEHFHENVIVEIIWTIIPLVILIGMAWPAITTLLAPKDASTPDLTIEQKKKMNADGSKLDEQRHRHSDSQCEPLTVRLALPWPASDCARGRARALAGNPIVPDRR